MMEILKELWRDESGATAVEYALIAGLMAAALVTVISTFKDDLTELFNAIGNKMDKLEDDISPSSGSTGS